jgi:ABC-type Na+ efflux pump permease subunit
LFVGPVFSREVLSVPRRVKFYVGRAAYVAGLLILMSTAWQVLTGTQWIRNVGDMARFGATLFQILAPLQLAVAVFFAALSAASAVAQEKDRRTLELLLLTNLSNTELVLGKLSASLLNILAPLAAAFPLFMLAMLFGGVALDQVVRVFAVTMLSAIAAGSLGSVLALWREKTFQTLALTVLVLVFWLAAWEAVARGALGPTLGGFSSQTLAQGFSPWQAILEATRPMTEVRRGVGELHHPGNLFLVIAGLATVLLNGVAVLRVRAWNPSSVAGGRKDPADAEAESSAPASQRTTAASAAPVRTRQVWDNPILWREICTWAYGRKILIIRLAYLVLIALASIAMYGLTHADMLPNRNDLALILAPLAVLSLVLINAQAVTSLTSERDARALDLLLVTDVTPKEFIYGKLGGVLYNTKEMLLLPPLLGAYLWFVGILNAENLLFLVGGWLVMVAFVAMLGVHSGMNYANSRNAIAVSLGTVFFLCLGVATCMRIMVAFSGSFQVQLLPFAALMLGGGVGLYVALGFRNPSSAIALASILCPFATFYAMTSYLLDYTLAVFLVVAVTYGFATAAMLIPALFEFDVATGRTTVAEE